eukprot:3140555-Pleurochrysis_carterae.AAC.2
MSIALLPARQSSVCLRALSSSSSPVGCGEGLPTPWLHVHSEFLVDEKMFKRVVSKERSSRLKLCRPIMRGFNCKT